VRSILVSVLPQLLCVAALCAPAHAQEPPPLPAAELAALREASLRVHKEVLTRRETYSTLRELCRVAPKRLSGSPGAAAAVTWARQTMTRLGLEKVRLEPCVVPRWVRGQVEVLKLLEPAQAAGPLPILALGGSVATPEGGVTAEVIAVSSFEELTRRAAEAKGKIVLFNRPFSPTELSTFKGYGGAVGQRVRGASAAAKVGGVAAIVRSMTPNLDDVPHTGGMRYAEGVAKIPTAAVSTRGAERIASWLKRGPVRLHLRLDCRSLPDEESFNVVGELRGRESPDEILVVGGHLDAWDVGEGAHDCGAGCAQSMVALATLKRLGLRPRRTIRCVLFMNEENGLAGGRTYAADHAAEMPKHVLALESDRGGFTPRGFTTDANPRASAILRQIVGLIPSGGDRLLPGYGGADISPMKRFGVVQLGFLPDSQRYFDLHHTRIDTFDKVHWRELELGTAAMATVLYGVAELKATLPRNPLPRPKDVETPQPTPTPTPSRAR